MMDGIVRPEWRLMREQDLPRVYDVGTSVHPDFPEEEAVFRDRFTIYPAGCFVLEGDGGIIGYGLSHPWTFQEAPALDSVLGTLPDDASTYYLHDIALLPEARAGRAASRVVDKMAEQAVHDGFATMSLIAVNGSQGFWEKQGFVVADIAALVLKLKTYSEDARFMVRMLKVA